MSLERPSGGKNNNDRSKAGTEKNGESEADVVHYGSGDQGMEIYENGVSRPATPDELQEIAQQHAGMPPSEGWSRFQFGEPTASTRRADAPKDSKKIEQESPVRSAEFTAAVRKQIQGNIKVAIDNLDITDDKRAALEGAVPDITTNEKAEEFRLLLEKFSKKSSGAFKAYKEQPSLLTPEKIATMDKSLTPEFFEGLSKTSEKRIKEKKKRKTKSSKEKSPEPETEEEVRERILSGLDPRRFTPYEVHHANWKGGEGEGTENTYTHPDAPGMIFTESERMRAESAAREKAARAEAAATPGRTARGIERPPSSHEPENDWNFRTAAFRDIEPKSIDKLLQPGSPDEFGFGILIDSLHPSAGPEIKRKLQQKIMLDPKEAKILNYARYEYTRRLKQVEYIQKVMSVADIDVARRLSPDFDDTAQYRDSARTLEVFKKQVLQMGMQRGAYLESLHDTYQNLTHLRDKNTYQYWEKGVQDLCARRGISMNKYDEAFKTGTPDQRLATRREIQEEIRHALPPFWRAVDRFTGSSSRRADGMVRKADTLAQKVRSNDTVRGVHDEMAAIVDILKYTMVNNPEVQLQLQQEAIQNQNLITSAEFGPYTYAEAQAADAKSSADIQKEFDTLVKEFKTADNRDWDHATKEERVDGMEALYKSQREKPQSGHGWFASVCGAFARTLFGQKEQELINKQTLK